MARSWKQDHTDPEPREGVEPFRGRRLSKRLLLLATLIPLALLSFSCSGCSPIYVAQAGWTEAKILAGRKPLAEVIDNPKTDEATRHKLLLTRQARAFAIHMLGLNAGDSYTTFTRVDSDVLAWVLSAAHKDRLESKSWWFPIVGRVPYRGFSSQSAGEKAERGLARDGFDTYLRPTTAFSTLGWFSDPLLSTLLRYDDVELVATVLHELSHNHIWAPGNVDFNESYATFVGRVGAIRFFCGPGQTPSNPTECQAARKRWSEYLAFSDFLAEFVDELTTIYARTDLTTEEKIIARDQLLSRTREEYAAMPPEAEDLRIVRGFLDAPLNNAILLGRMRYFHRLMDFQALLDQEGGDLAAAIQTLKTGLPDVHDPFQLLPGGSPGR